MTLAEAIAAELEDSAAWGTAPRIRATEMPMGGVTRIVVNGQRFFVKSVT
jgi:hypothetical protein